MFKARRLEGCSQFKCCVRQKQQPPSIRFSILDAPGEWVVLLSVYTAVAGQARGRECGRATRELSQYATLLDVCQYLERWAGRVSVAKY